MTERKASKPGLSRLDSDSPRPMVQEFPAPKSELFQRFHVYYLGNVAVAKPVGKERTHREKECCLLLLEGAVVKLYVCVCITLRGRHGE